MKPVIDRPHDAASHDQPMTPPVQRVIDEADRRARDKAAMPAACPTPTGCRENACHGACLPSPAMSAPKLPEPSDYPDATSYGLACWKQGLEDAANVIEPKAARPCDCTGCDCGNPAIYDAVLKWGANKANADAIRALAKEITP